MMECLSECTYCSHRILDRLMATCVQLQSAITLTGCQRRCRCCCWGSACSYLHRDTTRLQTHSRLAALHHVGHTLLDRPLCPNALHPTCLCVPLQISTRALPTPVRQAILPWVVLRQPAQTQWVQPTQLQVAHAPAHLATFIQRLVAAWVSACQDSPDLQSADCFASMLYSCAGCARGKGEPCVAGNHGLPCCAMVNLLRVVWYLYHQQTLWFHVVVRLSLHASLLGQQVSSMCQLCSPWCWSPTS